MNTQAGITKIEVGNVNLHGDKVSVSWETPEARFHVWAHPKSGQIQNGLGIVKGRPGDRETVGERGPVLYKNPLVAYKEPGYFDTRSLDATKPANAKTIEYVLGVVRERGLIDKALAAHAEKERQAQAEQAEAARLERIKEAGPQLFAAVQWAIDNCGNHPVLAAAIKKATQV